MKNEIYGMNSGHSRLLIFAMTITVVVLAFGASA